MRPPKSVSKTTALGCSIAILLAACNQVEVSVPARLLPKTSPYLGLKLGLTEYSEVERRMKTMGLQCRLSSQRNPAAAPAQSNRPQFGHTPTVPDRLSCANVPSSLLSGIRHRPNYTGHLMFEFDADNSTLTQVSFRRSHFGIEQARADIRATASDWKVRFERPKHVSTIPPVGVPFPRMKPVRFTWNNGRRRATLSALSVTGLRVDILEAIELIQPTSD